MKNLTLVLMAAVSVLTMFSCKRQDPQTKGPGFDGVGSLSPYFFTGILKPESLGSKECTANGYTNEKTDYTSLLLFFSGKNYLQFQKETFEEFKKLANKIGDVENEQGYLHATPVDYQTTESAISGVVVRALSQYDDSHPQGSSLKDIIRINYQSFDHVFDKSVKPKAFGSGKYAIEPSDVMPPIKLPALIAGTHDGDRYRDGLAMSIEFLRAPSVSKQQLQIAIQFENGFELKKDVEVDIVKIAK
jgi:lipoprotein